MEDCFTENCTHQNFNSTSKALDELSLVHPTLKITFVILELLISFVAIIGNLLVIIAFIKEPKLRRKTNYYIISLVCADFLVGLVGIPLGILLPFADLSDTWNETCPLRISILITFCNISIISLVMISIKRYIILTVNLPQKRNISVKHVPREISVCWVLGIFLGFIPLVWHKGSIKHSCLLNDVLIEGYITIRFVLLIFIPVIVMIILYFKIYKIILNQIKNESNLTCKVNEQACQDKLARREIKSTITISLIVLIFIICWIPVNIIYIIPVFSKSYAIPKSFLLVTVNLAHSNSAINPLLYAYHMKDIRRVIFKILRYKVDKNVSVVSN